ncbi:uncharacterized protein EI90DRAFT_2977560 [Cantharellus anzutake]|uniref:uncharacterized protein n=1 Tax=Cantharellus anzutake TaxID=1750568 RepID=UPI001907825E|nr:uncharacterized protein EI90DRAFT_2977560 [Cantharellus anzutake]KAF8323002.1 hypothetical protein EI90DRAFT_2977560 [Cantharellus anzutake]
MVRSFLDARSKDPKRTRPKDLYYAVLKGTVLFLYEDDLMSDCWAAIELSSYEVTIHPPGGLDGELFARRNAIMLRVKPQDADAHPTFIPTLTKETTIDELSVAPTPEEAETGNGESKKAPAHPSMDNDITINGTATHQMLFDESRPWFLFVKSNTQMEDWYLALVQRSVHPSATSIFEPLTDVYNMSDMDTLVLTLDSQPDPIPMRWLNALLGRMFFSVYKTEAVEQYIIGRLKRKLSKVKWPNFLSDIKVREVNVGTTAPTFSKPMLKQLTKEGDASVEMGLHYKGEVRITVEATATINLGARFKPYTVKLVLAVVLKGLQGNLLVKIKSPPSNRLWYAFTTMPKLEVEVEPVVSDRQIKWSMILKPIESMLKDVITESIVLPNMDDIPFFNTQPYQIRGGIFADAARKPLSDATRKPLSQVDPSKQQAISPEPGLKRSKSSDHLPQLSESASQNIPTDAAGRSEPTVSLPAIALHEPTKVPSEPPTPPKRNTWFGYVNPSQKSLNKEDESVNAALILEAQNEPEVEPRGRAQRQSITSTRAPSTSPSPSPSFPPSHSPLVEESPIIPPGQPNEGTLTTQLPGTQSPMPPVSPSGSQTLPKLRSPSFPHQATRSADFAPSRFFSRPQNDEARTVTSSKASTLLTQWKAKATDKEALSATARETIKKWGWGKKNDTIAGGASSKKKEDKLVGSPPKQTFEEIRAQVEERRQAERRRVEATAPGVGAPTHQPDLPTGSEGAQTSIVIDGGSSRGEATSAPTEFLLERRSSNASSFTGGVFSSGANPNVPVLNGNARTGSSPGQFISPSQPKITTKVATPNSSPHLTPVDLHSSRPKPIPLHSAQPSSAPKMSIPGIHASHRGEVQALGSTPAMSSDSTSASSSTSTLPQKLQSIQNMYKMFGNRNSKSTANDSVPNCGDGPTTTTGLGPGLALGPGGATHMEPKEFLPGSSLTEPAKQGTEDLASQIPDAPVGTQSIKPTIADGIIIGSSHPVTINRGSPLDKNDIRRDPVADIPSGDSPPLPPRPQSQSVLSATPASSEVRLCTQSPSKSFHEPPSQTELSCSPADDQDTLGVPQDNELYTEVSWKASSADDIAGSVLAQETEAGLPGNGSANQRTELKPNPGSVEGAVAFGRSNAHPPEVRRETLWVPPPYDS